MLGKRKRRGIRWYYILPALILCGGFGYIAPTLKAIWRHYQVESGLSGVDEMLKSKDYKRLLPLLTKAYHEDPQSAPVLRAMARWADSEGEAHPSDAVHYWQVLVENKGATGSDRLHYVQALVRAEQPAEARKQWDKLSAADRSSPEATEVQSKLLLAVGKKGEAESVLRHAVELTDDKRSQFQLSQMEVSSGEAAARSQARQKLWALARSNDHTGWQALQTLAALPDLKPEEAGEIVQLVYQSSQSSDAERRAVLLLCAKARMDLRPGLLEKEAERQKGKKLEDSGEYFAWIAKLGAHEDALRSLGEFKSPSTQMLFTSTDEGRAWEPNILIFESPELFGASATALIYARRWRDLEKLLGHRPSVPYSNVGVAVLRALCAKNLHEPDDVIDGHLMTALKCSEQTRDERDVSRVISACQQLQRDEVTTMACEYEYSQGRRKVEMLKTLFSLDLHSKQTNAMMARARLLRELAPELSLYARELDYLRLLTGAEMELVLPHLHDVARAGEGAHAELQNFETLMLALADYRTGNLRHCRELLDDLRSANLPRGAHAVLAGLLTCTGQREAGFYMALKIAPDHLLNEEKRFLDLALQLGGAAQR